MKSVATHEAKTHLSRLLSEIANGEEYLITRGRTPVARLSPIERQSNRPKVGEMMDRPCTVSTEALRPLTTDELAA
ncbi:MAG: type II toxin-antitoxin system Phd/YefM family antitoxin, partial [Chthoniobacterales bacterium]